MSAACKVAAGAERGVVDLPRGEITPAVISFELNFMGLKIGKLANSLSRGSMSIHGKIQIHQPLARD